ncbi:type I restriction enzyme, S subunit [Propionibacterium cyclohexanicum]|uniref:Type I restriction enzyme, S subunit n=1 Tax=Propionibacterium cyclohexanicum TaxID=64702 RepID=A0A1H9PY38_9ACTN|nr:restriction endonuclease subunit S [Propionibacterium cyclohexanicum]SER53117.1 type I restriction enzyme, S subunit [Propionibacterium cyclohexanicum]
MTNWPIVSVEDIAARSANAMSTGPFGSSIGSRFFRPSGIPIVRGSNLSADSEIRFRDEGLVFLDPTKAAEFSRSVVREGDLIFSCWGTINQVGLLDGTSAYREYVISNKQMKLTPDPSIVLPEYLYYLFSGSEMQQSILGGAVGTGVPGFNLARLKSLKFPLPPIEAQRRIADSLSCADRLITNMKCRIAKARGIRRGLIQELLTGRTRLPGFAGPWRRKESLLAVATKFSGYWGSAPGGAAVEGRVIRAGDVTADHVIKGYALRGLTTSEAARAALLPGDVVITASGTIGNVALISDPGFYSSNFIRALRPRPQLITGVYLYFALQTRSARAAMDAHLGLSAMPNLGRGFYTDPWLDLPPLDEQRAIGAVLQSIDDEIAALARRLESARAIKQGMMQELLTGGTRLTEGAAA